MITTLPPAAQAFETLTIETEGTRKMMDSMAILLFCYTALLRYDTLFPELLIQFIYNLGTRTDLLVIGFGEGCIFTTRCLPRLEPRNNDENAG
jgi:hypothetical protein